MKRQELLRLSDPVRIATLRAIKAALDPAGIMNPGKLVPSLRPTRLRNRGFATSPVRRFLDGQRTTRQHPVAAAVQRPDTLVFGRARKLEGSGERCAPGFARQHAIPLTIDELAVAQRYYPIIFSAKTPFPWRLWA